MTWFKGIQHLPIMCALVVIITAGMLAIGSVGFQAQLEDIRPWWSKMSGWDY